MAGAALPAFSGGLAKPLVAEPGRASLSGDTGPTTEIWGYNGGTPGPEMRVKRGDTLKVAFENRLPQPTSVHWHGIRIDNAMDGVSGMTQDAVPTGAGFDYSFRVPDAGTYWYHPHNRSWEQLARGLYGPLIVEEDRPYPVDAEQTLVIDDWRLAEGGGLHTESFGGRHDWSHGGRLGNWATVNGRSEPGYTFQAGERVRLRLINVANARIMPLTIPEGAFTVIALDGQPLAAPALYEAGSVLELAPAQRADIVVDMDQTMTLAVHNGDEAIPIARLSVTGYANARAVRGPVPPLPSNGLPEPDLTNALETPLMMEGGAMAWLQSGTYQGAEMDGRALAEKGQFWSFNGQVGMSENPLFAASRGQTVVVQIVNHSAWPHGIHFHGHHFQEVTGEGTSGIWRDTILLKREETKRIAFVCDNPGRWMVHCHMLEHQASGMATWFQVAA